MYIPIFGVEREIGVDFLKSTAQADDLRKMRESSLSVWNEVIYLYGFQPSGTVYKNAELDTWKTLLAGRKWKQS